MHVIWMVSRYLIFDRSAGSGKPWFSIDKVTQYFQKFGKFLRTRSRMRNCMPELASAKSPCNFRPRRVEGMLNYLRSSIHTSFVSPQRDHFPSRQWPALVRQCLLFGATARRPRRLQPGNAIHETSLNSRDRTCLQACMQLLLAYCRL